jgi:hypothetical protein
MRHTQKPGKPLRHLLAAVFLLLGPHPAGAESVSVNQGSGQGFIFNHRGNCYLILPQHVHGRGRTVTITTAAPSVSGDASIVRSFAPGLDLSVGFVARGLESQCRDSFAQLPARSDNLLNQSQEATLTYVAASGLLENVPMRIVSRDFDLLTVTPAGGAYQDQIFKGRSGAMLRIDGKVVGMAIASTDTSEATILRIDAIMGPLTRLIDSGAESPADPAKSTPAPTPGVSGTCSAAPSIPVAAITCSREPVSPDFACSNLLSGKPVRFAPGMTPIVLIAEFAAKEPLPVGVVEMTSRPTEGEATPPRTIRLGSDYAAERRDRWMTFGDGDMTPLGDVSIPNGSRPRARRLQITLASSWDADLPIQVDCLSVR